MCTSTTVMTVPGARAEILGVLTKPDEIARWSPVPFELLEITGDRLVSGTRARVAGPIAGRRVEFDVRVREASEERLVLVADGPMSIDVRYEFESIAEGTAVSASVSVEGDGFMSQMLAEALCALLATGTLRAAVDRIGRQVEPDK
jgi:hypothetical protein